MSKVDLVITKLDNLGYRVIVKRRTTRGYKNNVILTERDTFEEHLDEVYRYVAKKLKLKATRMTKIRTKGKIGYVLAGVVG